jgi:hypothetical protein
LNFTDVGYSRLELDDSKMGGHSLGWNLGKCTMENDTESAEPFPLVTITSVLEPLILLHPPAVTTYIYAISIIFNRKLVQIAI